MDADAEGGDSEFDGGVGLAEPNEEFLDDGELSPDPLGEVGGEGVADLADGGDVGEELLALEPLRLPDSVVGVDGGGFDDDGEPVSGVCTRRVVLRRGYSTGRRSCPEATVASSPVSADLGSAKASSWRRGGMGTGYRPVKQAVQKRRSSCPTASWAPSTLR